VAEAVTGQLLPTLQQEVVLAGRLEAIILGYTLAGLAVWQTTQVRAMALMGKQRIIMLAQVEAVVTPLRQHLQAEREEMVGFMGLAAEEDLDA
jgi:hypothetical protein